MNTCPVCQKQTKNPKFCSRSCSAIRSNSISPKRKLTRKCLDCDKIVGNYRQYRCDIHLAAYKQARSDSFKLKTLAEYQQLLSVKGKHPSWLNAHIRAFNRQWNKDLTILPCANCGYKKHVELAHKRDVSSFPLTATLGEVNAKSNNVQLCPTCHWEFDNDELENPLIVKDQTSSSVGTELPCQAFLRTLWDLSA